MHIGNIEQFFLNTILKILIVGALIVLLADIVFFPEDTLSLLIDLTILSGCFVAFLIRNKYPTTAVLTVTQIVLAAMVYQSFVVPVNTTTSLSIILVLGFLYSVMLSGAVMWIMHGLTFSMVNLIFIIQFLNPHLRFSPKVNDMVTVSITYSILYFILAYAAGFLKSSYDKIHQYLQETNEELKQKADEISDQNNELLKAHNNLNALNAHLEEIVNERTEKVQLQNEILYKYSYTNAHHLRGPVARLLGLVNVYQLKPKPDPDFIIEKMADQAHEIDAVIKQINIDLDANNLGVDSAARISGLRAM
jgi:signal transduction histidine kinase